MIVEIHVTWSAGHDWTNASSSYISLMYFQRCVISAGISKSRKNRPATRMCWSLGISSQSKQHKVSPVKKRVPGKNIIVDISKDLFWIWLLRTAEYETDWRDINDSDAVVFPEYFVTQQVVTQRSILRAFTVPFSSRVSLMSLSMATTDLLEASSCLTSIILNRLYKFSNRFSTVGSAITKKG